MSTRINWILVGILSISFLLRFGAAFYLGIEVVSLPGTFDQVSYQTLAESVLRGYGFAFSQNWWAETKAGSPTAFWSYLHTIYSGNCLYFLWSTPSYFSTDSGDIGSVHQALYLEGISFFRQPISHQTFLIILLHQ